MESKKVWRHSIRCFYSVYMYFIFIVCTYPKYVFPSVNQWTICSVESCNTKGLLRIEVERQIDGISYIVSEIGVVRNI